ncbi:MAG: hypothetical protein ACTH1D_07065 [Mycobacteriaceae bacterium]|uniref:hypothetical protein n=1 Tax=Corynebacterium sp. TaxID=1720 RepID=UPI003F9DDD65
MSPVQVAAISLSIPGAVASLGAVVVLWAMGSLAAEVGVDGGGALWWFLAVIALAAELAAVVVLISSFRVADDASARRRAGLSAGINAAFTGALVLVLVQQ